MFHDCAVHDIDVVCWIMKEYPESVFAYGHAFNQDIAAMPDVDTIILSMKFPSGVIASIDLSRNAVYGYDQRVEVHVYTIQACNTVSCYYCCKTCMSEITNVGHFHLLKYCHNYIFQSINQERKD